MLDPFAMLATKLSNHRFFVFLVEIEIAITKLGIFFHNFVKNIDIEWKSFRTFKLLDKLSTDWTSNTIFVMKFSNTIGTKSMSTMNQNSRNSLAYIIFETTELTNIKTS